MSLDDIYKILQLIFCMQIISFAVDHISTISNSLRKWFRG